MLTLSVLRQEARIKQQVNQEIHKQESSKYDADIISSMSFEAAGMSRQQQLYIGISY